jgi:lipoprotein-anchoring transpeptidase ErfK/SrfK
VHLLRTRPTAAAAAAAAVAGVALVALVAAGCSVAKAPGAAAPAASATPVASQAALDVSVQIKSTQPFDAPATFEVKGGRLTAAVVTGQAHAGTLRGRVAADGVSWTSIGLPAQGAEYDVVATVADAIGVTHQIESRFAVSTRRGGQTLSYYVTPSSGWTVGVNAPIVIRFQQKVTDRAGVQRALTVLSSTPVVGAWHWFNSSEVHFRPSGAWPTHTRVRLVAALRDVKAGPELWGGSSQVVDFQTGDSHAARVDGAKHTFTVFVNGKLWASWPTSMGRPQFATRSGNYIVLSRTPVLQMTSCSVNIACSKSSPNYYDLTVMQDVRLTWSGTFVHAAPWSVANQGFANVSHGCINLSTARATAFYNLVRYGDLVTVVHTARGPQDLVASLDPGMTDWNSPWTAWVSGSATRAAVVTGHLA